MSHLRTLLFAASLMPLGLASALAGPNGATVVAGSATVQGQGTASVVVNQTSQDAIINWQTFNIGTGETTTINMPSASSAELDRVTGGLGPSQIFGSLTSNGQVFLVNPDGILFGKGAEVNTGSFLATTHDIANADFMAGRYNFMGLGNPAASIVNEGTITAQTGGFAALVAPGVRNTGTITATLGQIGLASANSFALDFYGDRLIQLNLGDAIASQVIDVSTGKPLSSLVSNEGTLKANGGRVELTAVAAREVVDSVINNTGVIEANTIGTHNGMIVLEAATAADKPTGAPTQIVKVSGTLSAAGKRKGTTGGTIIVTGENVQLSGATLDASGQAGGGAVLIGGDWGGGHPNTTLVSNPSAYLEPYAVPNASTVSVDAATTINASATNTGNGGKVIVWSNEATTFYGTILAQGGAQSGNGGFVETSGGTVNLVGITVNASAAHGTAATWHPAPVDLIIYATLAGEINTTLNGGTSVALQTSQSGNPSTPYTLTAGEMNASGNGDIIVNSALSWTTATTLTLNSYNAITINAPITIGGPGGLVLVAANNPLATAAPLISFGNGASVQFTGTPNSGQSLTINGNPYTLLYSMSEVQNINGNLSGYYALALPLNASGVTSWTPIGTDGNGNALNDGNGFAGVFQGLGNTISNLTINLPSSSYVGLFGWVGTAGLVQNIGLLGGSVNGKDTVGDLIGLNLGTVSNAYATGAVSGSSGYLGGLIGLNDGTVTNAYATGAVSGSQAVNGSELVGGLIGGNEGTVINAYATGAVSGWFAVGGLIGETSVGNSVLTGTVTNAYATGAVSGSSFAGGLIGFNLSSVTNTYATGAVNGNSNVGGLIGNNAGTITQSYATGPVSADTTGSSSGPTGTPIGGLVGYNDTNGQIVKSYATGAVTGAASNGVGGLVGYNAGTVDTSYATGNVGGAADSWNMGGLVGTNVGSVTQSFATGTVSASGYVWAGALVGWNQAGGTILESYATGAVTGTSAESGPKDAAFGGLVGWNDGTITQSYATGVVSVTSGANFVIGGLVGNNDGTISAAYWDMTTSGIGSQNGVGNVTNAPGVTGLTTAQFGNSANFAGWNFGTTPGGSACATGGACWLIVDADGSLNNANGAAGATRPMLLSEWSTTITDAHQLQLMELDLSANYTLANNINLGAALSNPSDVWGPSGSAGFVPIGGNSAFTGTLNGNNNTISGLTIAPTNSNIFNIGLFGMIGVGGAVSNLALADATITADPNVGTNSQFIGTLAGQNAGTISNVAAGGQINGSTVADITIGGLVGINVPKAVITNSQAYVTVTSTASLPAKNNCTSNCEYVDVGGFVGQNFGTIETVSTSGTPWATTTPTTVPTSCAAPYTCAGGAVSVGQLGQAGGFVGENQGIISYAFATGAVTGAAGLPISGTNGPFNNTTMIGGFAFDNAGEISYSFATGTVGKSGTEYLSAAGFAQSNEGTITNSFATGNVFTGDNSAAGGFVSSNSPNNSSNSCTGCYVGDGANNKATISDSQAYGNVAVGALSIAGGFASADGGGNHPGGIFTSVTASGAVTAGTSMNGTDPSGNSIVGGLVGALLTGSSISSGQDTAQVASTGANSIVGGIAGFSEGSISHTTSSAKVSGTSNSYIGGAVGINFGSLTSVTVGPATSSGTNPTVTGSGSGNFIGGIAGLNVGTVTDSTAAVALSGGGYVGGVAGVNGTFTNESTTTFAGSSFPSGTIGTATTATGTGFSSLIGTSTPALQPAVPSWLNNANCNDPACAVTTGGILQGPTTASEAAAIQQTTQLVQTANFTTTTTTPPPVVNIDLASESTGSSGSGAPVGSLASGTYGGNGAPPGTRLIDMRVIPLPPGSGMPPPGETRFLTDQVMLQFAPGTTQRQIDEMAQHFGLTLAAQESIGVLGRSIYTFRIGAGRSVRDIIGLIETAGVGVAVQPNYTFNLSRGDNVRVAGLGDPAQYVVKKFHLGEAHRVSKGDNAVVAVIDSEIDSSQPDFAGAVTEKFDAGCGATAPDAHGTGMAGAIASHVQLLGIAPKVKILAICAFGGVGTPEATSRNIINGLDYAIQHGAKIVNMSFGGPHDPALSQELQIAREKGIVLLGAAGNDGPNSPPVYPGADPNVIAVTATDEKDRLFAGANQGQYVAVAAPGVDILVPAPNREVQLTTGTSVATAHVSGVAALLLAENPLLTPEDVYSVLVSTAKHLGPKGVNPQFGAGLVDPVKALRMAPAVGQKSAARVPLVLMQ